MDLQLQGKAAVVTGGSRGIGYATARYLCAEGAQVALLARDRPRLDAAVSRLRQEGGTVAGFVADTAHDGAVHTAIGSVVAEFGTVDILVNGAARPSAAGSLLADLDDHELRAEVETKVLGYLRCARAAAPYMIESGW